MSRAQRGERAGRERGRGVGRGQGQRQTSSTAAAPPATLPPTAYAGWEQGGSSKRPLEGLILDLDGTLADTIPLSLSTLRTVVREFAEQRGSASPDLSDAAIIAMFGPSEVGIMQQVLQLAEDDATLDALTARFVEVYTREHHTVSAPYPGILPLLQRLHAGGVRLALVTGKSETSARITLDLLGLSGLLDIVEAGQRHGGVKPEAIRRILAQWQVAPEHCAYLGDAPSDMRDALACGLLPLAAGWATHIDDEALEAAGALTIFGSVAQLALWLDGRLPDGRWPVVLSHVQAQGLLAARRDATPPAELRSSADLGRSSCSVELHAEGAFFPADATSRTAEALVSWAALEELAAEPNWCVEFGGELDALPQETLRPIRAWSDTTGWVRTLYPTSGAPTTLVSGLPMHRIQEVDPWEDTRRKVRAAAPQGVVLDTATGLGYSAIQAAATAERVISVELDPAALRLARRNPWSRELFSNPAIELHVGDVGEVITTFEAHAFARALHDPPAMALAGELYSTAFYRDVLRVLRRNGRLFHYIGDPDSASGRNITRGVMRRLQEAGFQRIERRPEAFGVTAQP